MNGLHSRRRTVALTALAAASLALAVAAAIAVADRGTTVRAGDLVVTAGAGVAPRALPAKRPAPVSLSASGRIGTSDGSHPPAPGTVLIEEDRNVSVSTAGLPTCGASRLQSEDTEAALASCRAALVGEGKAAVEIALAGLEPIHTRTRLLIFNGGEANGQTTLLIHAYVTVPTPAAVVVPLVISRVDRGRYGLLIRARVPKIAGGSGSVTFFSLRLARTLRGGTRAGAFTATCPDGRLQSRVTARFVGGRTVRAELIRGCAPRR